MKIGRSAYSADSRALDKAYVKQAIDFDKSSIKTVYEKKPGRLESLKHFLSGGLMRTSTRHAKETVSKVVGGNARQEAPDNAYETMFKNIFANQSAFSDNEKKVVASITADTLLADLSPLSAKEMDLIRAVKSTLTSPSSTKSS